MIDWHRPLWLLEPMLFIFNHYYPETSDIRHTLEGNKIVDHSDVVGESPVGADPTTTSFSAWHLASIEWLHKDKCKTRWERVMFWDLVTLYWRFYNMSLWCHQLFNFQLHHHHLVKMSIYAWIILDTGSATGWANTQNDPCHDLGWLYPGERTHCSG